MSEPIVDIARQMAREGLKLVWYHLRSTGKRSLGRAELQSIDPLALNTSSSSFKGPTCVPNEIVAELIELRFVEKVTVQSDALRSVFHLTDLGRAKVLDLSSA